jgi:lysyl-tRNA synthetase, class II
MVEDYIPRQDVESRNKVKSLNGIPPEKRYPYSFSPSKTIQGLRDNYSAIPPGPLLPDEVKIAGRIIRKREMGKTNFYDIQDDFLKIQAVLPKSDMRPEAESLLESSVGDIYGIGGHIMKTLRGELSIRVNQAIMLTKCLRPMPDKWEGLSDPEARYRLRPLELISDPSVIETFRKRTAIVDSIRKLLNLEGFLEVDTPILQPLYGGANARPFLTHHNSLNQDMFLRISNELYLKRLIIGGINRVYEFAKDFRNEGIDSTHNPEFTQLEIYQAFADYFTMMDLTERLVFEASSNVAHKPLLQFNGNQIGLTPPWRRITMEEAVKEYGGITWSDKTDSQLMNIIKQNELSIKGKFSRGKALLALFEFFAEKNLVQPTIVYDYPIEVSPLAKKHRSKEGFVERFEFFIGGKEFGNAYSELNDPIEQRRRFEEQGEERARGDKEAHPLDEDFLRMMEYGMPPTGGLGIGIDRLACLLTEKNSIKEVLFFPALRAK